MCTPVLIKKTMGVLSYALFFLSLLQSRLRCLHSTLSSFFFLWKVCVSVDMFEEKTGWHSTMKSLLCWHSRWWYGSTVVALLMLPLRPCFQKVNTDNFRALFSHFVMIFYASKHFNWISLSFPGNPVCWWQVLWGLLPTNERQGAFQRSWPQNGRRLYQPDGTEVDRFWDLPV